jgi:hypothetical protein
VSSPTRNLDLEAAAFANFSDTEGWRVYADWLLSVGDPHGEIVNLELAREEGFRSERSKIDAQLRVKRRELKDAFHEWATARKLDAVLPEFKRGFVIGIKGPIHALAPWLDELFEREPISRLSLFNVDDAALADLCAREPGWFARLRYLNLTGSIAEAGVAGLARVELGRIERLNLLGNQIGVDACAELTKLRTTQLRALTLTANQIDDEALRELLGSPTRSQWRELYLTGNPIDAVGVATLAGTTGLEQLEKLSLRDIEANFAAYAPLIDANWPNMRKLELGGSGWWSAREVFDRLRERFGAALRT